MLGTAIILFREVLEAALIIGIIAAATRGTPRRGMWISLGILAGITGACIIAAFASGLSQLANGMGQEVFNALVLGFAVLMLGWHNIWMSKHGRELAAEASSVGKAVSTGQRAATILVSVVGLAVLREGAEVVLFLYGLVAQGDNSAGAMIAGGLLGIGAGVAVGTALYKGLLRIPLRWFFQATSALVLLLAAGMAGQAARFLVLADILPALRDPLWDVSSILPLDGWPGAVLHALAGYDPQPSGMHMLVYVITLIVILTGMWLTRPPVKAAPSAATPGPARRPT